MLTIFLKNELREVNGFPLILKFYLHIPFNSKVKLNKVKINEQTIVAEMLTEPKPLTPGEYWDYVNEVCPNEDDK